MCKDNTEKPEEMMKPHHHHHHGPHGPKGGCKGKKEFFKSLDPDSLSAKFAQTARKFMHSSEEDIKNGTAFASLTEAEKSELETILTKMAEAIHVEKPEPEKENASADADTEQAA